MTHVTALRQARIESISGSPAPINHLLPLHCWFPVCYSNKGTTLLPQRTPNLITKACQESRHSATMLLMVSLISFFLLFAKAKDLGG